ncbi:putative phi PVL-like protein [Staphylococcus aureus]|nr:putative phi PVL-like protein [Staphylococcus aureus]
MEQITLTKEECVEQCINKDLKLLDYRVQQILEGVLSESTTYGDARNKLETLKLLLNLILKPNMLQLFTN